MQVGSSLGINHLGTALTRRVVTGVWKEAGLCRTVDNLTSMGCSSGVVSLNLWSGHIFLSRLFGP